MAFKIKNFYETPTPLHHKLGSEGTKTHTHLVNNVKKVNEGNLDPKPGEKFENPDTVINAYPGYRKGKNSTSQEQYDANEDYPRIDNFTGKEITSKPPLQKGRFRDSKSGENNVDRKVRESSSNTNTNWSNNHVTDTYTTGGRVKKDGTKEKSKSISISDESTNLLGTNKGKEKWENEKDRTTLTRVNKKGKTKVKVISKKRGDRIRKRKNKKHSSLVSK